MARKQIRHLKRLPLMCVYGGVTPPLFTIGGSWLLGFRKVVSGSIMWKGKVMAKCARIIHRATLRNYWEKYFNSENKSGLLLEQQKHSPKANQFYIWLSLFMANPPKSNRLFLISKIGVVSMTCLSESRISHSAHDWACDTWKSHLKMKTSIDP